MNIINPNISGTKHPTNNHHIVAKSRGGSEVGANKIRLYTDLHNSLHRVFGNLMPIEQLYKLLSINMGVLTEEFKHDILKILEESDESYFYKNGIYIKK